VAVIDPGPDLPSHVRAVVHSVEGADRVAVVLTHGHGDHAGGTDALEGALAEAGHDVRLVGAGHARVQALTEGEMVETDAGTLVAIHTPGHSKEHLCFHWPEGEALFAGDMVLGKGDTTWVAEYPGCVADYLASLSKLEALPLSRVFPAHGPEVTDPADLWRRYRAHREERIAAVRAAMAGRPGATREQILESVYGDAVPAGLAGAALQSLGALLEYVEAHPGATP
jgi:glyoxylase-like metal-dependent hydrolase (beta-lactamase superfamily II)